MAIAHLQRSGWDVIEAPSFRQLPAPFATRYDWLPPQVQEFITHTIRIVSPDEKSWFVTVPEIAGETESAFLWNQWELDSLTVAADDLDWQNEIIEFWNAHCPLLLSVKNGYSHLSIRKKDLVVVAGREPEFEDISVVAHHFEDLLSLVADNDPSLALYV